MGLAAQPSHTFLDILATALETAGATNLKIGLFTNSPSLTPTLLLSGLTEPVYTTYARQAGTIGSRRSNANGDIILPIGSVTFQPTADPASPITVNGYFLTQGSSPTAPWLTEYFDTPWIIENAGSALDLILEIYIRADPDYGGVCTVCTT